MFKQTSIARKPKLLGIFVVLSLLVNLASPAITSAAPRLKINPAVKTTTRAVKNKPKVKVVQPTDPTPLGQIKVSLSDQVVSQDVVNGTSEVPLITFNFENTSQQLVAIEELTLTGYLNETGTGGFAIGFDQTLDIKDIITSLRLFNENNHSASPSAEFEEETGRITFPLNFRLPPGKTRTITAVGNISSDYLGIYDSPEHVALDLQDVSENIKLKQLTTPVKNPVRKRDLPNVVFPRLSGDEPNQGFDPVAITSIYHHGDIQVMMSEYPVLDQTTIAGNHDILAARYKVLGTKENFRIRSLMIEQPYHGYGEIGSGCYAAIESVEIRYPLDPNYPETLDGSSTSEPLGFRENFFYFPDLEFMVPKDNSDINFEVYLNTFDTSYGDFSGCSLEPNFFNESVFLNGDYSHFRAQGLISGEVFDYRDVDYIRSNQTTLYKSRPTFSTNPQNSPNAIMQGHSPVYAFDVTADTAGSIGLNKVTFDLSVTGIDTGSLAEPNGFDLYELNEGGYLLSHVGSGTWDASADQVSIYFDTEETIVASTTKSYKLYAPINIDTSAQDHSVTTRLVTDMIEPIEMISAAEVNGNIIWSDRHEPSHSYLTPDWTNSYKIPGLPTTSFTLTDYVEPYVSVNFNGPDPHWYPIAEQDAAFLNLTLVSNTNVEVRNLPFKLTAEDGDGNADPGDLLNNYQGTANFTDIKVMDLDNDELLVGPLELDTTHASGTGSYADDIYQTLVFNEPFFLGAGESRNISLTMDIAPNQYLNTEDFYATFLQSGYTSFYDMFGNPIETTYPSHDIQGNRISMDEDAWQATAHMELEGPGTGAIAMGTENAAFFDFSIFAENRNIEIREMQIKLTAVNGDSYADSGDLLNSLTGNANFTDIKIVDLDNYNATVMGPQELSTANAMSNSVDDMFQVITFTDSVNIDAGTTRHFRVTIDVEDNSSLNNQGFKITLEQDGWEIRDDNNNSDTIITPTEDIEGHILNISESSAAVLMEHQGPGSGSYAIGSDDVSFFDFSINASDQDIQIKKLQITIQAATEDPDSDPEGLYTYNPSGPNFTDLKIIDQNTGEIVMGPIQLQPVYGFSYLDVYQVLDFTSEDFTMLNGETRNLSITMDIAHNPLLDEQDFFVNLIQEEHEIRDLEDNLITDISPSSSIHGSLITIDSPGPDVEFTYFDPGSPGTGGYVIGINDAPVFDFSVAASGGNIEIQDLALHLDVGLANNEPDRRDLLDSVTGTANYRDIKIIDRETGELIAGPVELSTIHAAEESRDDDGQTLHFTDPFQILDGHVKYFRITLDIANNTHIQDQYFTLQLMPSPTKSFIYDLDNHQQVWNIDPYYLHSRLINIPGQPSDASITFDFNGPASSTYPINSDDVSFFDFSITADEEMDVEIRNLGFYITAASADVNADPDDLLNSQDLTANFTDLKLIDSDTGQVVKGPTTLSTYGAGFSNSHDTRQYVLLRFHGLSHPAFTIPAGQTQNLSFTMDIANNSALNGEAISVKLALPGYKYFYDSEGNYIEDVTPAEDIEGNLMTVLAPSLAVTRASSPVDDTFVAGENNVPLLGLNFAAGQASDISITHLVFTGFIDENGIGGYVRGQDNSIYVSSIINSLELYDTNGYPVSHSQVNISPGGLVSFYNLNWVIPAGTTQKLILKGDVASNAYFNNTPEMITFDIADAGVDGGYDIGAVDEDGNYVIATGDWPNCGGSICTQPSSYQTDITITRSGDLSVTAPDQQVRDQIEVAGTDEIFTARYKVLASNENFLISDLTLEQNSYHSDCYSAIDSVFIKYPTDLSHPENLNGQSNPVAIDGSGHANFSNLSFMVPMNSELVNFEVYVNTNDVYNGADAGCKLQLDFDGDSTSRFEAHGFTSGNHYGWQDVSSIFSNQTMLYKTVPTAVTNYELSPNTIYMAEEAEVFAFDITADAGGPVGLYKIGFEFTPTGLSTDEHHLSKPYGFKLYAIDGPSDRGVLVDETVWTPDNRVRFALFQEYVIPAGETQHFMLKAPITPLEDAYNIGYTVQFLEDNTEQETMYSAYQITAFNFVWSDRHEVSHTFTTPDWTNGYRVYNLEDDMGLSLWQ